MRKFALISGNTRKDLNGENLIWFINPAGLGANITKNTANIQDAFYASFGNKYPQQNITGTLYVLKPAYTTYKAFVDWLLGADNLVLEYSPDETNYYKRDVELTVLTKTELTGGDWLECPITLACLTPWYQESTITGTGSVTVPAGGHLGASVKVTTGSVADGKITLAENGNAFAVAELSGVTGAIEYSNDYLDSYVKCGGADALDYVSTENVIFGHPSGGNAFTVSVTPSAALTVNVRKYWRTV